MCDYQIRCPRCLGTNVKKNALNLSKTKQQYKCRDCRGKFVESGAGWFISEQQKTYIRRLLLERISPEGHLPGGGHLDEVADGLHPADL